MKKLYSLRFSTLKKEQDDCLSVGSIFVSALQKISLAITIAATFLLITAAKVDAQKIVYVDSSKTVSGIGIDFGNAYKTLQEAIDAAKNDNTITQIRVKKGTYYPTKAPDGCTGCTARDYTFELPDNVAIYGGFGGNEARLSDRDLASNRTILSGDVGVRGQESDNSYHVVLSLGDQETILDGFTVKDGYMETNPSNFFANISGASIGRDVGAGAYYYNAKGTISNCVFDSQKSFSSLFVNHSDFTLQNSVVANNPIGNGLSCIASSQTNALNCLFIGNTVGVPIGGAIQQVNSFASVKFCTFYNNTSSAGVITNDNSSFGLESSIIWNNGGGGQAISNTGTGSAFAVFSLIEGGYSGTGNVNAYPQFARVDTPAGPDNIFGTADDGLRLVYGSPAMNTGNNDFINAPTDLLRAPRVQDGQADMGAYEGGGCPSYDRIYVDADIATPGGGDSWATATKSLSDAIAMAGSCGAIKEIWIKKGTYYPSAYPPNCNGCSGARDYTFFLNKNALLFGGFAGNETLLTQRDPGRNETILSGNVGDMNTDTDNCHHVVMILGVDNRSAILDGFTIQDGRADGAGSVLIPPPVNNQIFRNAGGGLWMAEAQPVINKCIFTNNKAANGGGLYMETSVAASHPGLDNCIFIGNEASSAGGGVHSTNVGCSVSNTIFIGNRATHLGGGMASSGSASLFNTTFYNNTAELTGSARNCIATNSIFWHNPGDEGPIGNIQSYSTIERWNSGEGNIFDYPNFRDTTNLKGPDGLWRTDDDGLKLVIGSNSINNGNNALVYTTTDITSAARIQENTVDRGAYEGGAYRDNCQISRVYVDAAAASSGLGTSWASPYKTLQEALNAANVCAGITEIWVKKGTYYPTQYPAGCTNCGSRDYTFMLKNNLAIYGGFSGSEATVNDRNLAANVSILNGNIGNAGDNADNCYHVVMSLNGDGSAIFDGFTVTGGQAGFVLSDIYMNLPSLTVPRDVGAGLYNYQSSPTVSNSIFSTCNSYATIFNDNNASPAFTNVVFANNSLGAAMYNKNNSSPSLINCLVTNNGAASGNSTGGISNNGNSNPVIKSTTFYGNNYQDGLIYSNSSSPVISGSILWGKAANGMIVNNGGTATVSYSIVEGGFAGAGNINSDPLFTNAADPDGADDIFATADDGLMVTRSSPAVDADKSGTAPTKDILGTIRPLGYGTDLGAYEAIYASVVPSVTITSSSTNICVAGNITFTASAVNEGATPGYQWKKNDVPINNATQATYTAGSTDLSDGDKITLTLTSSLYASPNPVTSNIITIQTPDTLFVDASVAASGDGSSWATAFKTLAEALDASHLCPLVETVLIAKGTYVPMSVPYNTGPDKKGTPVTSFNNRNKTFHVRSGLELYGGYPNGGGARNIAANATILDGANVGGISGEYAYHVVLLADNPDNWGSTSDTTKLSGLIIKNGKADGNGALPVNNYNVELNRGGGIYVSSALNLISNNVVMQNNAGVGAGIYSVNGLNNFFSNVFAENTSTGGGGGGYTKFGETRIANNVVTGNTAASGGGLMIDNGLNELTNNTFYNNTATTGGGLHSENGTGTYTNNIFRENKVNGSTSAAGADYHKNPAAANTFKNNAFQLSGTSYTTNNTGGNYDLGTDATGNIFEANPYFTNPSQPAGADGIYGTSDDGLRLGGCSPAINAGNNDAVANISRDFNANARVFENTVDMGAYELTTTRQSLLPDVNITGSNLLCSGSANTLTATAGFASYLWSNGSTGQSINVSTPAKYIVTATDAAGCMAKDSVTVVNSPASNLYQNNFQRNGGAITYGLTSYWLDYYHNRATSMWYKDSIDLNYDFELTFNLYLGSAAGGGGMAFVLQKAGIYALGRMPAASLGYYDAEATFDQSVAIELDMNDSGAGAPWYDPAGPHIAFVKNGSALPVAGPFTLLKAKASYLYTFKWDHLTHTLSMYQDGALTGSMSEDVVNTVFGGRSKVIFGFTGASNTADEFQIVEFKTSYPYVYDRQLEIKQECGSATLLTNAAPGSTWLWSNGSTESTIQAVPGNTYSVTTTYGGCTFTAEKYVAAVTNPVITASGPVNNICPGTPITFTASAGQHLAWINNRTTQSITVTAPGSYSVLVDGCRSNEITITNAAGGGLAAGGDEVVTNISGNTLLAATDCRAMAFVEPGGSQPLAGSLTAKTWVETAVLYYKSEPYVPRHFEMAPAQNADNATARVTLYFSQQDFNLFNTGNPTYPLPSGENDGRGKASLRVVQYHGNGDNTGLPGGYPVSANSPVVIDPKDEDIIWNADIQRWEVSFEVTGFSGFFVTSSTPLPVSWISFSARRNDASQIALDWKVNETAVSHYEVQRSLDARNFAPAGTLAAQGDGVMVYTFTDPTPVLQQVYYRIKEIDLDGRYSYSRILSVPGIDGEFTAFPNPAGERVTVQIGKRYIGSRLRLVNKSGVVLQEIMVKEQTLSIDLGKYTSGVYLLSTEDGNVMKLVKE